ncbi:hypothetical protein L218DRAFT_957426 [Marasmius fiardii PR-910]|nr:hypothetical protein L218DRAFT_957426 [Marasmius fiardii PR-910]
MARANPQSKALIEHLTSLADAGDGPGKLEREVLILFNYPIQHYVTPKFYRETKPKTGKVGPTWNYAVYGKLTVYYDSQADAAKEFLTKQLNDLVMMWERDIMEYEDPWVVDDAPKSWIDILKKAIIGLEIEITSMAAKWKMSQELPQGDRDGVADGFREMDTNVGMQMSRIVEQRGALSDRKKTETKKI